MPDLHIERLQLEINDAAGHEHRIAGIAQRAADLLAERIEIHFGGGGERFAQKVATGARNPIQLDLSRTSDEHAAECIANAWFEKLALKI